MTDIGDVARDIYILLDPNRAGGMAITLTNAAIQANGVQEKLERYLDGTDSEQAGRLRRAVGEIAAGLESLRGLLPEVAEAKDELFAAWGANPAAGQGSSTAGEGASAVRTANTGDRFNPWADTPEIDRNRNYFTPETQEKLRINLATLFSPENISDEAASERILAMFYKHGQRTVGDVLSSGGIATTGSLGQKHLETIQRQFQRHCPEIPLQGKTTPLDVARFSSTLHTVPIQAVLPWYKHVDGKRQTVTDFFTPDTHKIRAEVRNRFAPDHIERVEQDIRDYVTAFNIARKALARRGLDKYRDAA